MTVLVVAKAPIPGLAKTRLAATVGDEAAAIIAAAALLDTLDAVLAAPIRDRVVALTGDVNASAMGDEILSCLRRFTVIEQRGHCFADRLANAHADAAHATGDRPILQIGMDTPQVTAELIAQCSQQLLKSQVLLGMARDGGWWVLGVRSGAMAECIRPVPMSQSDTGNLTLKALQDKGFEVQLVDELVDVDTVDDIGVVRPWCLPGSRFASVTAGL